MRRRSPWLLVRTVLDVARAGWSERRAARRARVAGTESSDAPRTLRRDVGYALRQVRRTPAFSGIAIATLALGIGVNTAMFSAVDAVLIRPLPYVDAGRLVMIWDALKDDDKFYTTPPEWREWRRQNTVFTDIAASQPADASLSGAGEPEKLPARKVTANFWTVLGTQPLLGRVFTEDEDTRSEHVVVISHGLWQRRFGGVAQRAGSHHHAERHGVQGRRRDAARVLLHAGARYRHLDAGQLLRAACWATGAGTTCTAWHASSPE